MNTNTLPQVPPSSANLTLQKCCRIIGCIGLLVALGWFIATGLLFYKSHEKKTTWIPTTGRVVELVESTGEQGETLYSPVFQFTAADGSEHRKKCTWASSHALYSIGESIEVIYPADAPGMARQNTFMAFYFWPCVCAFVSCMFAMAAGAILLMGRMLPKR